MVFVMPFLAVVAGVLSFSSPCCLPLLPGYVSYVSGLPTAELDAASSRRVVLRASLLFVAGFTLVFTVLGASFAVIGSVVLRNAPVVTRFAGVGVIALGLVMLGVLRVPVLGREWRLDLTRVASGPRSALFLGMAFALGWAPTASSNSIPPAPTPSKSPRRSRSSGIRPASRHDALPRPSPIPPSS